MSCNSLQYFYCLPWKGFDLFDQVSRKWRIYQHTVVRTLCQNPGLLLARSLDCVSGLAADWFNQALTVTLVRQIAIKAGLQRVPAAGAAARNAQPSLIESLFGKWQVIIINLACFTKKTVFQYPLHEIFFCRMRSCNNQSGANRKVDTFTLRFFLPNGQL